ncbi:ribose transport system ATP-binding protein [Branchiibius hedensis]|uniref:Ribose transport system ATP-binding protein n=1 Tax=Branchiibius hedensis TaxID=672460 RepID=A0A2Y8ZTB3_9MICO|nr:sugar ABC transporter ATP-binding protein [Branchiibius hedensis]PWJ26819.1 ribose transport system ATP-binding protein [Branchiibius hedensis]SSA35630.1 ribose transport system ATP-binding protein [Branchiibius hedensis]
MTFGTSRVLKDVTLEVAPGEIHGLIGQNGSGKSTLAKVLTGLYDPDSGTRLSVDGIDLSLPVRPSESRARGVAVVHQSLGLVPEASVLENMRLGRLKGSRFLRKIDWAAERADAERVFERLGRSVPLDVPVATLREDERATVAIARALQDVHPGEGLIIFDESTRALGRKALEHFFGMLDDIVATGTACLLITHRLEEIVDAADRVTILRDGRVIEGGRAVRGMSEADLTALMLGRDLINIEKTPAPDVATAEAVHIEDLSGRGVQGVGFAVAAGEVVGLTGLGGSGYDDVPYLLTGATPADSGRISLPDETIDASKLTPSAAIRAGIALVPEGRDYSGLAMAMSVSENTTFPQTARRSRSLRPFNARDEKALVSGWIERLDVQPPDPHKIVGTLSGGNQQKVLLAKWLATKPQLFVLHEPTQAVDVGARHTIVETIRQAAAQGCAVVVSGSDENELALLCDRILVFSEGEIRKELGGDSTPDDIVNAIYATGSRTKLRQRRQAS